jgi:hypothetical protein
VIAGLLVVDALGVAMAVVATSVVRVFDVVADSSRCVVERDRLFMTSLGVTFEVMAFVVPLLVLVGAVAAVIVFSVCPVCSTYRAATPTPGLGMVAAFTNMTVLGAVSNLRFRVIGGRPSMLCPDSCTILRMQTSVSVGGKTCVPMSSYATVTLLRVVPTMVPLLLVVVVIVVEVSNHSTCIRHPTHNPFILL